MSGLRRKLSLDFALLASTRLERFYRGDRSTPPYTSELSDLAFDKDIDSQHMTVERILQDSNVNAWNQDDQYVVQCQGIAAAFAHDNVGFEARCHVGLTAK